MTATVKSEPCTKGNDFFGMDTTEWVFTILITMCWDNPK